MYMRRACNSVYKSFFDVKREIVHDGIKKGHVSVEEEEKS